MTTIKQAADMALNLGKQLQSVIEIGKVLDKIGNLESTRDKAMIAATEADRRRLAAEERLSATEETLKISQDKLYKVTKELEDLISSSKAEAETIVKRAAETHKKIIDEATDKANNLLSDSQNKTYLLQNKRDDLNREITEVGEKLTNLKSQMRGLLERLG